MISNLQQKDSGGSKWKHSMIGKTLRQGSSRVVLHVRLAETGGLLDEDIQAIPRPMYELVTYLCMY